MEWFSVAHSAQRGVRVLEGRERGTQCVTEGANQEQTRGGEELQTWASSRELSARPLAEEGAHDEIVGSSLSALGSSLSNIPTPTEGAVHSNSPTALSLSLAAPAQRRGCLWAGGFCRALEAERNPARPRSGRPVSGSLSAASRAAVTLSQGQRRFSLAAHPRQFPTALQAPA
ncbi:hypothetical protein KIL84_020686 [Mauremys mutica]|uniref:Uncharacterized protein n=1 Tax=Mauremys mutica TaxID=74926 RepID=A0A9D3XAK8_9SAUR|nr:hypothetical protein KIL84_020686 [Mauremys mutica]